MSLDGKVAFVTGAASGIGLSCARILLERGASVVAFDRNEPIADRKDELRELDDRLHFLRGDVSSPLALKGALDACITHFGALDFAFNCAGIGGAIAPIVDQADESLDETYAVNMRGVFLAMKYEATRLSRAGQSAIVNVASNVGLLSSRDLGLYGATKFGVIGLTQAAAVEFAEMGIRVNAVAPGPTRTPFIGPMTDELEEEHSKTVPLQRFARPDEIAYGMLWLASPEASFVNGATLVIDGGQSIQLNFS
jgi:NAD(P)-dependent dehydrogenase (short-subunit alcohol dehydrogenase family)